MAPLWPCSTSLAACSPPLTRTTAWWWRQRFRNRSNAACGLASKPSADLWITLLENCIANASTIAEDATYDELNHPQQSVLLIDWIRFSSLHGDGSQGLQLNDARMAATVEFCTIQ